MANSHTLITGGAGFIGSHLTRRLLEMGHRVTVLDNLSTGGLKNLAGHDTNPNLRLVRDSVENERTVSILMADCDRVYHLASAVGVQLVLDEPVHSIRTTIHGTEVVLESAFRFGRPVLITSSSEVYGKGTRVPFDEDDDVLMGPTQHARWCYAYSKGIDEFLGLAYHQQYGLPVTIVRLFNTVGPGQVGRYGMVLPRFAADALAGRPLKIFGDGEQTRCFCHVEDVIHAMIRLSETPASVGKIFNLGSDQEISINRLAARVIELAGSSSTTEHQTYQQAYGRHFDDMRRRVPKLDRIRKAIDFHPKHDLDDIIRDVLKDQAQTA